MDDGWDDDDWDIGPELEAEADYQREMAIADHLSDLERNDERR